VRRKPSWFLELLPLSVSNLACRQPIGIGGLTKLCLLSCKMQESAAARDAGVTGECISCRSECYSADPLFFKSLKMELFGSKDLKDDGIRGCDRAVDDGVKEGEW